MKKQKICIIGGNLTGLITAISLSDLNCDIDLITGNSSKKFNSNRTLAISESNLEFIKNLNISKFTKKDFWPCSVMKLYSENKKRISEIFEFDNNKKSKKILYMIKNSKLENLMKNSIKKIKSISVKNHAKVSNIFPSEFLQSIEYKKNKSKYNLVIVCAGIDPIFIQDLFKNKIIKSSYKEKSITVVVGHSYTKNYIARQIFLNDGVLALLPISNYKTSIVWSVKKNENLKKNDFIKKEIKHYAKLYLKNIKFLGQIESKDLNFLIREKYFHERILLFGDSLHLVHPLAGQGFNMTLRDLILLEKNLKNKIELGLDIGSSDVLSEFSNAAKPRNFLHSIGINLLKDSFSIKNASLQKYRNNLVKEINKNNFTKNILVNIADKGIEF